jgi:LPXTG-site transpeptidase (sortase) family protein
MWRLLARFLSVTGLVVLVVFAGNAGLGLWQARQLDETWLHQVQAAPPPATPDPIRIDPRPLDGVDFAIDVPKLDYRSAVAEGVDDKTLAGGPGHYPGMAWPGQDGNVGVAAHNVYWIAFNDLQPGDLVKLEARWGTYTYRISSRRVVWPDDRSILVPTPAPQLTLTTCWPLWAGAFATQRLVFIADQVDPAPGRNASH